MIPTEVAGVVTGGLIIVLLTIVYCEIKTQLEEWNNGICQATGKPWVRTDVLCGGTRQYHDASGIQRTEISLLWIDRKYVHKI